MNPDTEEKENILGETSFQVKSYKPSSSVETYYARKGSTLWEKLKAIVDKRSKGSELKTTVVDVMLAVDDKDNVTVEDIIALHAEFEYIHPFQDGNGRVGRLVALKECLRHNVIPFIIEDAKKNFYYRGLSEWRNEKGWLTDTCLDGQDTFVRLLHMLEIPYDRN